MDSRLRCYDGPVAQAATHQPDVDWKETGFKVALEAMDTGLRCSDGSEATIVRQTETYKPDVDWKETVEAYIFSMDLPGLNKNEVIVGLEEEERVLKIVGERKWEKEEEHDKWHVMERRFGKFIKRLPIPENARADEVAAFMTNGVLTITIPKNVVKKPHVKYIAIKDEKTSREIYCNRGCVAPAGHP